ncbi:hypothetical protein SAMN04515666_101338 [Bosea lupini]|uniref:Uncharacterized protein n=1 Tax=Bosea lupini TaxID=1036779 RepID=A0A1H7GEU1_9HYPH|nr:transcriptional regulator [Bosea lupini]SEK36776.1 hypothetical protein SAMN04515666_101338 [Bosea lupini]
MTGPLPRTLNRVCAECGAPHKAARPTAEFCSATCRKAFNNRRALRGAELYDLFMAHRFERQAAQEARVLHAMNRLASNWREEDKAQRAGRKSWRRLAAVMLDRAYLYTITVVGRARRSA